MMLNHAVNAHPSSPDPASPVLAGAEKQRGLGKEMPKLKFWGHCSRLQCSRRNVQTLAKRKTFQCQKICSPILQARCPGCTSAGSTIVIAQFNELWLSSRMNSGEVQKPWEIYEHSLLQIVKEHIMIL